MAEDLTYQAAGVDIEAAHKATMHLKDLIRKTQGPEVLTGIGAFGGLFQPAWQTYTEPVLVSSADGIGTKVMVAQALQTYHYLGHDIVNHCVNDIMTMGATPLFFLDYLAFGKFSAEVMQTLVTGIVDACSYNKCALLGGETAEMPDLYRSGDFDIAGFIVGLVDKTKIIDGHAIKEGDVVVGIHSRGLHTNGYSLVRKIFFDRDYSRARERITAEQTLGEALLQPHVSYFPLLQALQKHSLHGIAHITGGGIAGNLSRILPSDCNALIEWGSWEIPTLFHYIQEQGSISEAEMRKVFNMGLGLILVANQTSLEHILKPLETNNFQANVIGRVTSGQGEVHFV